MEQGSRKEKTDDDVAVGAICIVECRKFLNDVGKLVEAEKVEVVVECLVLCR